MIAQTRIKPPDIKAAAAPTVPGITTISTRDTTTKLEIDSDGDGAFDTESTPGIYDRKKVIIPALNAKIDIKPDAINLSSVIEKSITAYIELPADFNPKDIDTSSILLFGKISPQSRSVEFADHDRNGISELVVSFSFQSVAEYLTSAKLVQGDIAFTITFTLNGRTYTVKDVVAVSGSLLPVVK
jgi:hypothetical protein